jgi:hypothetical protein
MKRIFITDCFLVIFMEKRVIFGVSLFDRKIIAISYYLDSATMHFNAMLNQRASYVQHLFRARQQYEKVPKNDAITSMMLRNACRRSLASTFSSVIENIHSLGFKTNLRYKS